MFYKVAIFIVIILSLSFGVAFAAGQGITYQALRDYAYGLLDDSTVNDAEFTKLVVEQGYKYRFVDWLGDAYHSVFFNNPKGSEVLYNDFVMALAIGYERLGKPDKLKEPLTRIIDRRLRMWHDWSNSNHYAREYASLASLAYLLDDNRLGELQEKVRKSVDKLYLSDGYSYEGPGYGLYSMSILSGYVYFTDDMKIKQKIISNINWLASISSIDRYQPPFEDSLARLLPTKISTFPEVNSYWQSNFRFNNISKEDTFNNQETIWRYDDTTIWIRHRERNNELQGLHRNYSNGDVLLKVDDLWWLVAPGYMGWDKKDVKPEYHNVAMSKVFYPWRSLWRVFVGDNVKLLHHEEEDVKKATIQLNGKIIRSVESDNNSLVVRDKAKNNFKQFWQINGELVGQRQDGDIVSLQWKQGDKFLTQVISGVYNLSIEPGVHTGKSKTDLIHHTRLIAEGKDIVVRFVW
jgi:hypothetical protein